MLQIRKLYNIMSLAIKKVEECVEEHDFERMRNLDESYEIALTEEIKRRFPDMFDKDTRNVSEVSEWQLARSTLMDDLERYLEESVCKEELIFLVKCLDSFLEDSCYGCVPVDQEQYHFQSLNDNYEECRIYLIPRLKCAWEHRNRDAYTSYSIYFYLRNFYYIHGEDLGVYKVQHILMPREIFHAAICRGELRIMVSPVSGDKIVKITEPYIKNSTRFVSVDPVQKDEEQHLSENMIRILGTAADDETDIMLFPEMLGTEWIVERLENELSERENICDSEFPRLTICPTIWAKGRNSCRILDDIGVTVCEQCKHYGVDLKQWSAKEDIESDQTIYVLHCEGVGRIAIAICKDFLITRYLSILAEKLMVNLLLVPSFTGQDYQFEVLVSKYGDLDCNVIWVNTCSARWLDITATLRAAVTRAYIAGVKGSFRFKAGIEELCGKKYSCNGTCKYIYRIEMNGVC